MRNSWGRDDDDDVLNFKHESRDPFASLRKTLLPP